MNDLKTTFPNKRVHFKTHKKISNLMPKKKKKRNIAHFY